MTRVAVITGGNKGIGYEIVKGICQKFDGDVILAARDEGRGKEAVSKLQKEGLKPKFQPLDIDSKESIESFKEFLEKDYGGLDILVNNAGMAYPGSSTAPVQEQAENTVRVNFYGTKNVCNALFPLLRPHARVVNLSSSAGMLSKIPNENIREEFKNPDLTVEELCSIVDRYLQDVKSGEHKDKGWAPTTYCMSKIPLTKLTFIQQKQFDKDPREDLVVNAVHPGFVDTDMTNHKGPLTPKEGASAPIYLALLPPNVKSPRGEFVWNDSKIASWI